MIYQVPPRMWRLTDERRGAHIQSPSPYRQMSHKSRNNRSHRYRQHGESPMRHTYT